MEQNMYHGLRSLALEFKPAATEPGRIFGVLTDIGMDLGTVTIVTLNDGTTSMYLSSGGGTIGGGEHESIREASNSVVEIANELRKISDPIEVNEYPLPSIDEVFFYLLTPEGKYRYSDTVSVLLKEEHPLSKLFYAVNNVMTGFRKLKVEQEK